MHKSKDLRMVKKCTHLAIPYFFILRDFLYDEFILVHFHSFRFTSVHVSLFPYKFKMKYVNQSTYSNPIEFLTPLYHYCILLK